MENKNFQTFCNIIDYLDKTKSNLAEILRGTCVAPLLNPRKGRHGITFLMPVDADYITELENLAYSSDIANANKAAELLSTLIVKDHLVKADDWKNREVVNSLYPMQVIEVDKDRTSYDKVVFKCGATAKLHTNFSKVARGPIAIWELSGRLPITNDKPPQNQDRFKKKGNYELQISTQSSIRTKIALAVEHEYVLEQIHKRTGAKRKFRHIYYENIYSLLNYLLLTGKKDLLLSKILPHLSGCRLDFYILLEPHNTGSDYLIDEQTIIDWWDSHNSTVCNMAEVRNKIDEMLTNAGQYSQYAVYGKRNELIRAIDRKRKDIKKQSQVTPRQFVSLIKNQYDSLSSTNSIDGIQQVYPPAVAEYYKNNPNSKLCCDELRYLTHSAFKNLECEPTFDLGRFNTLLNMIGDYMRSTADQKQKMLRLLNTNHLHIAINPVEYIAEINTFLCSTAFMNIPMTKYEADNYPYKHVTYKPPPGTNTMFNITKDIMQEHNRLISYGTNSDNIRTAILSLDPHTLDPELLRVLRDKMKQLD